MKKRRKRVLFFFPIGISGGQKTIVFYRGKHEKRNKNGSFFSLYVKRGKTRKKPSFYEGVACIVIWAETVKKISGAQKNYRFYAV